MLWNLRIHLCIWVRQLPTTVTLNPKSSADPHYRQMWGRHFASHCGASCPFRVSPRCAYTMQQSCLCCCTARRPGLSLEPCPPGLTALTVGFLDRFLAFTGTISPPMKRCGPLPDSPRPPLWLPPPGPLVWTCASHATAPSFSCYSGLRPWLVRLEASPRSPTHPLDWRVRRDLDPRPRSSRNWTPRTDRDEWRALVNLVGSTHDAPQTRWW